MGNTSKWSISLTETGKSCGQNEGNTFKVYIAKVLPLVSFADPIIKTVAIKPTCFCNSEKCKPSISSNVKTRNYVEVSKSSTANIDSASHGTKLKISVQNSNIDKMYVEGHANK